MDPLTELQTRTVAQVAPSGQASLAALYASENSPSGGASVPTSEPAVISTNTGKSALTSAIDNHNTAITNIKNKNTPPVVAPDTTKTTSNSDSAIKAIKAQGGVTADEANSTGITTDMLTSNYNYDINTGYYIPKDNTAGVTNAQNKYQSDIDKFTTAFANAGNLTPAQQSIIDGITKNYQARIKAQQDVNAHSEAAINTENIRNGTSRYAGYGTSTTGIGGGVAGGILTAEENAGLDRINTIKDEMNTAIMTAEDNLRKGNISEFMQQHDALDKMQTEQTNILKDLHDQAITAKNRLEDKQQKITEDINNVVAEAAKNGAPASVLKDIGATTSESDAIAKAGDYMQTASGTLGDYLQYKRETIAKGLVPSDYQTYKDQQDAKTAKLEAAKAYNNAYAASAGKNAADAKFNTSDKNQEKLEQQYRQVLSKEFSARTGALGVENAKVNQANHINSLLTQYYDPKTGNYNVPTAQYAELVLGLANLISPTGNTSDSDRANLMSKTASGDLRGAVQYITGVPQNGNTQEIIKNLVDSVDRQAVTATQNREAALQNMRDQAPTDLEQSRIDKLNKSTEMVPYSGQDRISKIVVDNYVKAHPEEAAEISKLYKVPGATNQDIEDYLKNQGKLQ